MKTIRTDITINAPIETVWECFMDFSQYSQWNPFIRSLNGEPIVGGRLEVVIQPEGQKAMAMKPVLLQNDQNKEFRWKGSLGIPGLFDGEHYFTVEKLGADTTRFIQGEKFSGILVRPIMAMVGNATLAGFKAMNQALKQRAEAK